MGEPRRRVNDPGATRHGLADEPRQLLERVALRADGIDDAVTVLRARLVEKRGHVLDKDRLEAVGAVAGDREDGKPAEEPGDVVHEDVLVAEDDGGTYDGIRHAEPREILLEGRLP